MHIQSGRLMVRGVAVFFLMVFMMVLAGPLSADEIKDEKDKNLQQKAEEGDAEGQAKRPRIRYYLTPVGPWDLEKAAEKGDAEAQYKLGMYWEKNKYNEASISWYTKAAEQGHIEAQFKLGNIYSVGLGSIDQKQANYWYIKCAEKGHLEAQKKLASRYHFEYLWDAECGQKNFDSIKQAIYWYTKAAEQGDVRAQSDLGDLYREGTGTPQNNEKAVYWYTEAAEQGLVEAQFNLALMYLRGQGVTQNYKQAFDWFTEAAEQGHADAQFILALMYERGEGVPQDYKQALYWFKKAAEQGHANAQDLLSSMYFLGKGIPENYTYSYVWSSVAAAQGFKDAQEQRDFVASLLSPAQLVQAQALAAEIQYKIEHPEEVPASAAPQAASGNSLAADAPKIIGNGTGFIITKDGYLFTCLHVIENADIIKVAVGRDLYPAKLIRADANCDLALLKIDGVFNALAFSPKRTAAMGEDVFTVGFPNPDLQGMNPKLTKGSINSLTGLKDDLRLYQISVPVQPGNSGGPLLDANGNVCGIVVAMLDAETAFEITGSLPQNVNYAVKSTYAQTLLDTLPEVGKKSPAPSTKTAFDVVTASVEKSIVMVLTYE